MDISGFLT